MIGLAQCAYGVLLVTLKPCPTRLSSGVSAASPGRKTLSLSFGSLSDKARASQLGVIELGGWERGVSNRDTRRTRA
jgi:hypothetical protein